MDTLPCLREITRNKIRENTVFVYFPLCCPKCKQERLFEIKKRNRLEGAFAICWIYERAGMSPARYQLAFRKYYGFTPYEYLKEMRLNRALLEVEI